MTYRADNPWTITDTSCFPWYVVTRYATAGEAQWYLGYLYDHGGLHTRVKIDRGDYRIINEVGHA